MKNPYLVGQAIYLRPLERDDAPLVQTWFNDPDVRRTLRSFRPISKQAEEAFIDKAVQDEHLLVLVIVHKESDQAVGVCGLHDIDFKNRHAMFGITIGVKEFWGQGIGTEATRLIAQHAFDTVNLHRLCLHVYEFNDRAMRIYARVGFRQEGVLRQDTYRDGRYWDTIVMGLLRDELKLSH